MSPLATARRGRSVWLRAGLAATAAVALAVLTGGLELPSVGALLAELSDALGTWAYMLVPALAFFETAAFLGLVLPGETAVLVGGVVAERGEVSLPILITLVWTLAVAGDVSAFLLGRRLGGPFLRRHARRLRVKGEHVGRIDGLFARHGGKTIVIGRFVGVLRAFTPFVAGTTGMTLRRFLPYSAAAALAWAALFTLLGYAFSSSVTTVGDTVTRISMAAIAVAGLALWIRRVRLSRTRRDSIDSAPSASPIRSSDMTGTARASDRPALRWRAEAMLFVAAYLVYWTARWIFVGDAGTAQANGHAIWELEQKTGTAIELSLQRAFDSGAVNVIASNLYLAAQIAVLPAAIVWLYRRFQPIYRKVRTTIIATWMLSVPIFAAFPVAPPRLANLGFTDTVSDQAAVALTGSSTAFYNAFAAVPSLHVGFAFVLSCAGVAAARSRWAKLLATSWAPIVTFVVVATGNHYVFDALAGIAVTAAGFAVHKLTAHRQDVLAFVTHPLRTTSTRRQQPMITAADPRSATRFPLTRIAHFDDHVATRAGLRSLVAGEPDLLWVGAAADEAELWTLIRRTHPSLVVLDVHHPGRGGLELCAELKATVPTPAVLIYTSEEHEDLKIAAQLVGADGVITKDENRRALLEAIRLAGRGESGPVKITPSLRARAASRLDPTDRAIFAMRLAGTAPAEIALTTGLSSADVAGRIASIATRLSSSAAEPPEIRNGQEERGGFALRGDVPRLRGSGRQRGPTPHAA